MSKGTAKNKAADFCCLFKQSRATAVYVKSLEVVCADMLEHSKYCIF